MFLKTFPKTLKSKRNSFVFEKEKEEEEEMEGRNESFHAKYNKKKSWQFSMREKKCSIYI